MAHPEINRAMAKRFKRSADDNGGPGESATFAYGEMTLLQAKLKSKAVADGVTLYSVAGTGQNVTGHIGTIAPDTGGFAFALSTGIEVQFGQGIQVFGSRYLVQWSEDAMPGGPASLDISTTRKDVKLIAQKAR